MRDAPNKPGDVSWRNVMRNIIWHIAHHGGGSREDIPARQKAPTLMPLAQVGQPHLDTASSAPRGMQHDISKGWLGRDRHQHVDMSMRQNALSESYAQKLTALVRQRFERCRCPLFHKSG